MRPAFPPAPSPGLYQILSDQVTIGQLRKLDIEDLLRREPVAVDAAGVAHMLAGSRVLITGAGGSIGSELVRQIARFGPAEIILLGHGENSIFDICNELRRTLPSLTQLRPARARRLTGHVSRFTFGIRRGTDYGSLLADHLRPITSDV